MEKFAFVMIILGMIVVVVGMLGTNGPLQGGAVACIGLTCGALPYLLYKLQYSKVTLDNQKKIISLLEAKKPE